MSDPHIVRTGDLDWSTVFRGRHPFNPASEMRLLPLASATGMKRMGVNLVRVPAGKESFIPHAHAIEEEFVFVLEGAGEVVLDGAVHPLRPGDFVGFPTDGVVHSVRCTGPGDLVYLTAGTNGPVEVADMPTIGKTTVFQMGQIALYDKQGAETLTQQEWMARVAIRDEP